MPRRAATARRPASGWRALCWAAAGAALLGSAAAQNPALDPGNPSIGLSAVYAPLTAETDAGLAYATNNGGSLVIPQCDTPSSCVYTAQLTGAPAIWPAEATAGGLYSTPVATDDSGQVTVIAEIEVELDLGGLYVAVDTAHRECVAPDGA